MNKARQHASSCTVVPLLDPMDAVFLSILVEQQKEIRSLREALSNDGDIFISNASKEQTQEGASVCSNQVPTRKEVAFTQLYNSNASSLLINSTCQACRRYPAGSCQILVRIIEHHHDNADGSRKLSAVAGAYHAGQGTA
jgi:hypothetical protein